MPLVFATGGSPATVITALGRPRLHNVTAGEIVSREPTYVPEVAPRPRRTLIWRVLRPVVDDSPRMSCAGAAEFHPRPCAAPLFFVSGRPGSGTVEEIRSIRANPVGAHPISFWPVHCGEPARRTPMSRATSSLPSLLLVLSLPSCDGPTSHEYDAVDTPQPIPAKIAEPPRPKDAGPESMPTTPDGCGRGTGRNAQGDCEQLHTRELEYVQQVQLPAGRFVMGDIPRSYATEIGRHDPRERWSGQPPRYAEAPAFWIDLHEVTRGAYAKCVEAGKCTPAGCPDGVDPVEKFSEEAARVVPQTCVTHEQAATFCEVYGGRLPSEVEWEYAARGPDARLYPWGNDLRDEYTAMLMPVSASMGDVSYFGLRGLGTSAIEWVADAYTLDVGLVDFVREPFRRADGPLRRAEAARGPRFIMKGGKSGVRRDNEGADRRLGFRCAADLGPDEVALTVPAEAPSIPILRDVGNDLQVFGGVAEAVDRREAEKFCEVLRVELEGKTYEGWRLPTLAEIQSIQGLFRGPGPFWAADGAVVQKGGGKAGPDEPWEMDEAENGDALAARCVRDVAP